MKKEGRERVGEGMEGGREGEGERERERERCLPELSSTIKRGVAKVVLHVDRCSMTEQISHCLQVTTLASKVQWSLPSIVR